MNSIHPTTTRFREPTPFSLSYLDVDRITDLNVLQGAVREQQQQIDELQWCVAALLDALGARHMMRLEHGLPIRSRHDESPR